jgi:tetratricopeptide (TPR) repeat protein/predicted Ser/Thr protein kinase
VPDSVETAPQPVTPAAPEVPPHTTGPRRLKVGDLVGRYVLLGRLGAGGMGIVFSAYDPELDRKLALKLLRPERRAAPKESAGHRRLLREAQALAKLTHANVITVHDVGEFEGSVFIAMEFIDGHTLSRLRSDPEKSWRRTLDLYVRAGRGLAAAHAAGLIHRDFKPDNVMLGKDGRVVVMDFGLARPAGETYEEDEGPSELAGLEISTSQASQLSEKLTRTGQLIGTPAYMAPEQHARLPADERTDQYAFCVSLYEGLYGERPFAGDTRNELVSNVAQGIVKDPPKDTDVPAWVRKVVLRGLSVEAPARWPSVADLLAALQRDPTKRWKRGLAMGAAVAVLGGAFAGLSYMQSARAQLCAGADTQLEGVWDDDRRQLVREAFENTGVSYAEGTLSRVEDLLDAHTGAWVDMHVEACEATNIRREQSADLLDLRMGCLQRRIRELDELVGVFAEADAKVVEKAVQAVGNLRPLDRCADLEALTSAVEPPEDEATRDRVAGLRARIARAEALEGAGKFKNALTVAEQVEKGAREVDYAPLHAEALFVFGRLQGLTGKYSAAEQSLSDAVWAARASGHDEYSLRAASQLVSTVGNRLARPDDAELWVKLARADLRRTKGGDEEEALLLADLAVVRYREGKREEALEHMQQALELMEKIHGPNHPRVAVLYNNLGGVQSGLGKLQESLASNEKALGIRQTVLGPDHPDVATSLSNLGRLLADLGRYDEARDRFEAALRIMDEALGERHSKRISTLLAIGNTLRFKGELEQSRIALERGLLLTEQTAGEKHPDVATALTNLGETLHDQGEFEAALSRFERARKIRDAAFEKKPQHPHHAYSLTGMGRSLIGLGRPRRAIAPLERALSIRETKKGKAGRLAETRFALAQALWETGRDRTRAIELAEKAREGWQPEGKRWEPDLARVEAWLAEHEPG